VTALENLKSSDKMIRAEAANSLKGSTDKADIEALVRILSDEYWIVRKAAADSLVETGAEAVDHLLDALEEGNEDTCYWASRILGRIDQKDLTERLIALLDHARPEVEKYAARALLEKGEVVIEDLITTLRGGERQQRFWAVRTLGDIGSRTSVPALIGALEDEDWAIRQEATRALGEVGAPEAADELRDIIVREDAWTVRVEAARALSKIRDSLMGSTDHMLGDWRTSCRPVDTKVIDSLVSAMEDETEDLEMKLSTIHVLGEMGGGRAVDVLLSCLTHPRGEIRAQAARALGKTGDRTSVPALGRATQDSYLQVRKHAVEALGLVKSRRSVDYLTEAMMDTEAEVRSLAAKAIGLQRVPESAEVLLRALSDESEDVRYRAAESLGKLGARRTLTSLIELLQDPSGAVRESAISAMGSIGDLACVEPLLEYLPALSARELDAALATLSHLAGPGITPHLTGLLNEESNRERRYSLIESLGRIGSEEADETLLDLAENGSEDEKIWAVEALKRSVSFRDLPRLAKLMPGKKIQFQIAVLGTLSEVPGKIPFTPLKKTLNSPDETVRMLTTALLGRCTGKTVFTTLTKLISDENKDVRFAAVRALGALGSPESVPHLITVFTDSHWPVRKSASEFAGKLEPLPHEQLIKALGSDNPDTRYWSVRALGVAGEPASVPPLTTMLSETDPAGKRNIIEALGKIGSSEAVDTLLSCFKHQDYQIRLAAVKAIKDSGDARTEDPLLEILNKEEGDICYWAARALGQAGSEKSLHVLKGFTGSSNFWLRKYAAASVKIIESRKNNLVQGSTNC